jgi:hypothetical protein
MKPKFDSPHAAFVDAVLIGMAAPTLLFSPLEYPRIHADKLPHPTSRPSGRDAMRGDWYRIGADFERVIAREIAAEQ